MKDQQKNDLENTKEKKNVTKNNKEKNKSIINALYLQIFFFWAKKKDDIMMVLKTTNPQQQVYKLTSGQNMIIDRGNRSYVRTKHFISNSMPWLAVFRRRRKEQKENQVDDLAKGLLFFYIEPRSLCRF